jgi:hypothetical protein
VIPRGAVFDLWIVGGSLSKAAEAMRAFPARMVQEALLQNGTTIRRYDAEDDIPTLDVASALRRVSVTAGLYQPLIDGVPMTDPREIVRDAADEARQLALNAASPLGALVPDLPDPKEVFDIAKYAGLALFILLAILLWRGGSVKAGGFGLAG